MVEGLMFRIEGIDLSVSGGLENLVRVTATAAAPPAMARMRKIAHATRHRVLDTNNLETSEQKTWAIVYGTW